MGRPVKIDRRVVLLNAMRQFWAHGYQGTSLNVLESVTGLKRGSLYAAFPDKHTLFLEVIRFYREEIVKRRRELIEAAPNGRQGIEAFFRELLNPTPGLALFCGCLVTNTIAELANSDAEVQQLMAQGILAWEAFWSKTIRRGQRDGSISKSVQASSAAKALCIVSQGVNVAIKGLRAPEFSREAVRVLLGGILGPQ